MSVEAVTEGTQLWTPRPDSHGQVDRFLEWLEAAHSLTFSAYDDLWEWSVRDISAFWQAMWEWTDTIDHGSAQPVIVRGLTDTAWFPGAALNYVEHALRAPESAVALVSFDEQMQEPDTMTYGELRDVVARTAAGLRTLGVRRGDRVAAYLPNVPETVIAFLATASIGAIWTCCSPDFGAETVLDRFRQVDPVILLATTSYQYNGRHFDRSDAIATIREGLDTLRAVVDVPSRVADQSLPDAVAWRELTSSRPLHQIEAVPFDHPLWIVYTSGTTGMPKSIVHGHGGVLLEHQKLLRLHLDLDTDDRFLWFSTTGWVMWNILVSGLLVGASIVLYDGSPAFPSPDQLWSLASRARATFFGLSAAYVESSRNRGLTPARDHDLSLVRSIGVTGSPLSPSGFAWLCDHVGPNVFVGSMSGGTDVCSAFLGQVPTLPVSAGQLQRSCLGVEARCLDDDGSDVVDQVGELVITSPMPSMPVAFWADDDDKRYHETYFRRFPGQWHHGDWVKHTREGTWVVYGRSDATLNRGGVRMGTAEFYRSLETVTSVQDALVIDLDTTEGTGAGLLLLVVLADDTAITDVRPAIDDAVRKQLSPRHVPDEVIAVKRLPHTLNGKRMEIPIKRIFLGEPAASVLDRSAVDSPEAVDELIDVANRWHRSHAAG